MRERERERGREGERERDFGRAASPWRGSSTGIRAGPPGRAAAAPPRAPPRAPPLSASRRCMRSVACAAVGRPLYHPAGRQRPRGPERFRDRDREREAETDRQRGREAERQRGRETERDRQTLVVTSSPGEVGGETGSSFASLARYSAVRSAAAIPTERARQRDRETELLAAQLFSNSRLTDLASGIPTALPAVKSAPDSGRVSSRHSQ